MFFQSKTYSYPFDAFGKSPFDSGNPWTPTEGQESPPGSSNGSKARGEEFAGKITTSESGRKHYDRDKWRENNNLYKRLKIIG